MEAAKNFSLTEGPTMQIHRVKKVLPFSTCYFKTVLFYHFQLVYAVLHLTVKEFFKVYF